MWIQILMTKFKFSYDENSILNIICLNNFSTFLSYNRRGVFMFLWIIISIYEYVDSDGTIKALKEKIKQ